MGVWDHLRSQLAPSSYLFWLLLLSALVFLLERLRKVDTNEDFLDTMNQ